MTYTRAAVERAMKVQEVILRAMSGRQSWLQVADVLGLSPRTVRRLRLRYQKLGYSGLFDRRRRRSPRAVPVDEVQRVLRLYRERYGPRDGHAGFNVRHFWDVAQREHGVQLSYSFVKQALQGAGLVTKRRARGRHRRRREPRPCFGELLHLDGSRHRWLALCGEAWQTLLAVVDDATKRLLYAQLVDGGESVEAVMTALRAVLTEHGIPGALYTDRAHWAVHTPTSGTIDRARRTQVGRALAQLGIEHILSFSPQARGRSERANGTLQGRLVNELRVAGIATVGGANRYLREQFIADDNRRFARAPADPASAFVPIGRADLEHILCHEEERVVARDNTVSVDRVLLQLDRQPGRRTCAGLRVLVRRHLDGTHSVWWGRRCLGRFSAAGRARSPAASWTEFEHKRSDHVSNRSGQITCQRQARPERVRRRRWRAAGGSEQRRADRTRRPWR